MKVRHLIARLQTFDPEWPVVINGVADGLDDVDIVQRCQMVRDMYIGSASGTHVDVTLESGEYENAVESVVLRRSV